MSRPTKQRVKEVMEEVEALDLPDGAHFCLIEEKLGLDPGDLSSYIAADPDFFGYEVKP